MKFQKLVIAQRLDIDFLISATDECAQFIAQHASIATCDDNVGVGFCAITSDGSFKFLDVLYLIDKDIVMFIGLKVLSDIVVEILIGLNVVKLSFLLIYKDDIVAVICLLAVTNHFHHAAFTYTTLTY